VTTGPIAVESPSPFAVFRNRNFTFLWTGQLVSTIGAALTSLAASIFVYRATGGSAMSVGLMLMATAAPSILVGLIAGVFVDRFNRKWIMIASDVIRAGLVVAIPFLAEVNIAWLYVLVILSSAVGQFFNPAHESVLPEVASERELAAANSLMAISSFGSTAIGFAAAGLLASGDINLAFYLDSVSFLISALCILLMRIKPLEITEQANVAMVVRNLRAGMRFLFDTTILRSLFYVSIPILIAFGLSNALLLPFSIKALEATEFEFGIQEGLTSLGFVFGSLLMATRFDRLREGQWMAISYIGMAVIGIIYSRMTSVPLAIIILTVSGFLNAPSAISRRIIIQQNTPREMRGRVSSGFFVSRDVFFLVGMGAAGLADIIDVRLMYLFSALLVLGGGVWVLFLPGLRQERAQWRKALNLLRSAPAAPALDVGRAATLADLDTLIGLLPSMSRLTEGERKNLLAGSSVVEAPAGSTIIQLGEAGDTAYFILSGKTVAGVATPDGGHRSLSIMKPGDFFGEIAALTGTQRTANVVAEDETSMLQVPAETLRELMGNPVLSELFLSKMTERLVRSSVTDLPRFAGLDQKDLRDLRTPLPEGESI